MYIAIILVLVGLTFLLKNLGLLDVVNWSVIWPSIIIVLGASMLIKRECPKCVLGHGKTHHKK